MKSLLSILGIWGLATGSSTETCVSVFLIIGHGQSFLKKTIPLPMRTESSFGEGIAGSCSDDSYLGVAAPHATTSHFHLNTTCIQPWRWFYGFRPQNLDIPLPTKLLWDPSRSLHHSVVCLCHPPQEHKARGKKSQ